MNDNAPKPGSPPQPQPAASNIPLDFVIPIALSVAQINYILSCLNQRPYHEVKLLIDSVQGQGDMALAAAGYGPNARPKAQEPAGESPPADPPAAETGNGNKPRRRPH